MREAAKIKILKLFFLLLNLIVIIRLFYWQFLSAEKLTILAENQYQWRFQTQPLRGEILAADGFPLVTNQRVFLLYALKNKLEKDPEEIAGLLGPLFLELEKASSPSASLNEKQAQLEALEIKIKDSLTQEDLVWLPIRHKIPEATKEKIDTLQLSGLGFEDESLRLYPEASSAAHLLGFVGQNEAGEEIGYFGIEGFYNLELKGRPGIMVQEQDAVGRPILLSRYRKQEEIDGSNLVLHLDRGIQLLVEEKLEEALERYGAKAGSVIVSNPKTGAILAMVSHPSYDPADFQSFNKDLFKNPVVSDFYEPGSTFKIITMAAALDQDAVKPETKCEICDGPLKLDKYVIRTWNEEYYPDSTMIEVLEHSDNIGMVFVAQKLGIEKFVSYLKLFGFDRVTGLDLQEEMAPILRKLWSEVDLATAAFGQGIAVTRMQMLQGVNIIANQGTLMKLQAVSAIENRKGRIEIEPEEMREVIKPETAKTLTEMLVKAVDNGEAQWAKPKGFKIAGKTGTSQIPISGHYDEDKTIASFIGFAPADDPAFSMLVTLREPTSSPWGSETAAPLWFSISRDLFVHFNIPPE